MSDQRNISRTGQVLLRLQGGILTVSAAALPLFVVPSGWDSFRFPKVLFLRAAAIAMIAAVGIVSIWCPRSWQGRAPGHPLRSLLLTSAVLLGWVFLSIAVNHRSALAWFDLLSALVLFFSAADYAHRGGGRRMLMAALFSGIVTVLILFGQVLDLYQPLVDRQSFRELPAHDQVLLKRSALLGNRDDVGIFLLIPLAVAIHFVEKESGKRKPLYLLTVLLLTLGVLVTTTVTAIVIGVVLLSAMIWRMGGRVRRFGRRAIAAVSICVAMALAVAGGQLLDDIRRLTASGIDAASGHRLGAWATASRLALDNPVFGVGPGGFSPEYPVILGDLRVEYPELLPRRSTIFFDMAHNDYLEIAAETGLVGLALSLVFVSFFLRESWRHRFGGLERGWLGVDLSVAMLLAATLQFPLQIAGVYGTVAILAGACMGSYDQDR